MNRKLGTESGGRAGTPKTMAYAQDDSIDAVPAAPGEVLKQLLVADGRHSQRQIAAALGISPARLSMIIQGRCRLSTEIALRVERAFGVPPTFWTRVREDYDLFHERRRLSADLAKLHLFEKREAPAFESSSSVHDELAAQDHALTNVRRRRSS